MIKIIQIKNRNQLHNFTVKFFRVQIILHVILIDTRPFEI